MTGSGSGTGSWSPPPPMFGPMPPGEVPAQPSFPPRFCTSWLAYDVPRMWDMFAAEAGLDDERHHAWTQAQGFGQLADLLWAQYRHLQARCADLAEAWQSAAGQYVVQQVQAHAEAVLSDATCAQSTGRGLHAILTSIGEAKVKMQRVQHRWENVTTDWVPEWWDSAAEELNVEARTIMAGVESSVADNRKKILIPDQHFLDIDKPPGGEPTSTSPDVRPFRRIPPVPGYDPVEGSGSSQAELAGVPGVPSKVPAVPGAPVSMLPIPPGNPLAPYGGAYILPGPGVGKGGYVVPMPPGGGGRFPGGGPGGFMPGRAGAASGSGVGMMPVPLGTPMPGGAGGQAAGGGLYRRPNTTWQTDKGVPPVISGIADDVVIADRPSEKQEATFQDWFAELAYPWRKDNGEPQPQVLFRRTPE